MASINVIAFIFERCVRQEKTVHVTFRTLDDATEDEVDTQLGEAAEHIGIDFDHFEWVSSKLVDGSGQEYIDYDDDDDFDWDAVTFPVTIYRTYEDLLPEKRG